MRFALVLLPRESNKKAILETRFIPDFKEYNTESETRVYRYNDGRVKHKCLILYVADSVKELKNPNLQYQIPKINYSSGCTSSSENQETDVPKAKKVKKTKKRNLVSSKKTGVDENLKAHQKDSLISNKGNKDFDDKNGDKENEGQKETDEDTYDEELEFQLNRGNLSTTENSNLPRTAQNSKFNMQAGSSKFNYEEEEDGEDPYDDELEFDLRNNALDRENLSTTENSHLPRTAHNSKFNMQSGSSKRKFEQRPILEDDQSKKRSREDKDQGIEPLGNEELFNFELPLPLNEPQEDDQQQEAQQQRLEAQRRRNLQQEDAEQQQRLEAQRRRDLQREDAEQQRKLEAQRRRDLQREDAEQQRKLEAQRRRDLQREDAEQQQLLEAQRRRDLQREDAEQQRKLEAQRRRDLQREDAEQQQLLEAQRRRDLQREDAEQQRKLEAQRRRELQRQEAEQRQQQEALRQQRIQLGARQQFRLNALQRERGRNRNINHLQNDQFLIGDGLYIPSAAQREAARSDRPSEFVTKMTHAIWPREELINKVVRRQKNTGDKQALTPRKVELLSYHFEDFLTDRNYSEERIQIELKKINTYLGRAITSAKKKVVL